MLTSIITSTQFDSGDFGRFKPLAHVEYGPIGYLIPKSKLFFDIWTVAKPFQPPVFQLLYVTGFVIFIHNNNDVEGMDRIDRIPFGGLGRFGLFCLVLLIRWCSLSHSTNLSLFFWNSFPTW